jgi:hypothetical protein
MLFASLTNRVIRHQGPHFGITSKKHKHNGVTGRVLRHAGNQFLIAPHLSLIVLVAASSLFGGAGSLSSTIPIPGDGQWVDFGRNEPTISSGAFTFPGPSGVAGYFYTKPPATIARDQTVTLVYSIEGSAPVWEVSDPTDVPPATMHLFLWRRGDDLSCNGAMASYRFWASSGVTLKLGDSQTLASVLDPSVWTNCYGEHDTSGFAGALENAMGIGFTFGGQNFFGHGVYLSNGSATFKVNSYTVR